MKIGSSFHVLHNISVFKPYAQLDGLQDRKATELMG